MPYMKVAETKGIMARVFVTGVVAGIFVYIYFKNPLDGQNYPHCFTQTIFGFRCIGCGATRAVHYLLNGDIGTAFKYNPVAVILFPLSLLFMGLYIITGNRAEKMIKMNTTGVVVLVMFVAGYTAARNIFNF